MTSQCKLSQHQPGFPHPFFAALVHPELIEHPGNEIVGQHIFGKSFKPVEIIIKNATGLGFGAVHDRFLAPIREICANWAAEIAEALEKGRFAKVEKRGVFEILPW